MLAMLAMVNYLENNKLYFIRTKGIFYVNIAYILHQLHKNCKEKHFQKYLFR